MLDLRDNPVRERGIRRWVAWHDHETDHADDRKNTANLCVLADTGKIDHTIIDGLGRQGEHTESSLESGFSDSSIIDEVVSW